MELKQWVGKRGLQIAERHGAYMIGLNGAQVTPFPHVSNTIERDAVLLGLFPTVERLLNEWYQQAPVASRRMLKRFGMYVADKEKIASATSDDEFMQAAQRALDDYMRFVYALNRISPNAQWLKVLKGLCNGND